MKSKIFSIVVIFLISNLNVFSQTWEISWEKQMGTPKMDMFSDVIENIEGGYTVLGSKYINEESNQDFWLVKFDDAGNVLWEKTFGTEKNDFPVRLTQAKDGSYVLVGKIYGLENNFQAFLLKISNDGEKLWEKKIGDNNFNCAEAVIVTDEGNIIVAGTKGINEKNKNIWLAQFSAEGELNWEKTFGETKMACSESLKKMPDGGFFLAGQIAENGINDSDLWVFRFNSQGDKIWDKQIKSVGINVWPECICCSPDSNLIIVGWYGKCMSEITSEDPIFDYDLFVTKLSPSGELIWTKNIDSEGSEGGNAVVIRPDGNILMAGKKETSFLGRIGPWLLLANPNGEILSELVLPFGFNSDKAAQIINTSDGGFLVIGPGEVDQKIFRSNGWIKKFKAF